MELKLLQKAGKSIVPSGFGLLLFGKKPRASLQQAGLLATIHRDGREEIENFEGPMVFIPDLAITWLKNKLPNPIIRTDARRREANDGFYELVREGLVNALVHRNYDLEGAKCHLIVNPETVVIRSPGAPVEPIATLLRHKCRDSPWPELRRDLSPFNPWLKRKPI